MPNPYVASVGAILLSCQQDGGPSGISEALCRGAQEELRRATKLPVSVVTPPVLQQSRGDLAHRKSLWIALSVTASCGASGSGETLCGQARWGHAMARRGIPDQTGPESSTQAAGGSDDIAREAVRRLGAQLIASLPFYDELP